jgi:hypothetical protein
MFADAGSGLGIKISNNPTSKDWPRIPPLTRFTHNSRARRCGLNDLAVMLCDAIRHRGF